MKMTHKETMGFIAALREKYLGEQEETIDDKVERARVILETHKHGSHNQASHGFRFGKAPSLTQARRYRKAGVLAEYSKRSRERSGTKPAKERNANKPKQNDFLNKTIGGGQTGTTTVRQAISNGRPAFTATSQGRKVGFNSEIAGGWKIFHH